MSTKCQLLKLRLLSLLVFGYMCMSIVFFAMDISDMFHYEFGLGGFLILSRGFLWICLLFTLQSLKHTIVRLLNGAIPNLSKLLVSSMLISTISLYGPAFIIDVVINSCLMKYNTELLKRPMIVLSFIPIITLICFALFMLIQHEYEKGCMRSWCADSYREVYKMCCAEPANLLGPAGPVGQVSVTGQLNDPQYSQDSQDSQDLQKFLQEPQKPQDLQNNSANIAVVVIDAADPSKINGTSAL